MAPHLFDINNVQHGPPGILDNDGVFHSWGVLDSTGEKSSYGVMHSTGAGVAHPDGVLEAGGADYYALWSELSSPYLAGAAAQKVTDAAFLETNKDEIIEDDTDISAEFGVSGLAVEGVDPADIVSLDYIKDGMERYVGSETYGSYPTTEASFAAGNADQLATDILAVTAELGNMTTAVVDLLDVGNDGTLDLDLYTLLEDVKTVLNTNKDEMIEANTDIQAAYSCDAGTVVPGGGGAALSRVRLGM